LIPSNTELVDKERWASTAAVTGLPASRLSRSASQIEVDQ